RVIEQFEQTGQCVAALHGTPHARHKLGCRCPLVSSQVAFAERLARRQAGRAAAEVARMEADRAYAVEYYEASRRTKKRTGGRLEYDPRQPWRHGSMAVDRVVVDALVQGVRIIGKPTHAELLVAVVRITGRRVTNGPKRSRPINAAEIGKLIGVNDRTVYRLRNDRRKLAEERDARRLADAQYRAALCAAGADRRAGRR
ncbi:MAG: hypothetical protein ABW046_14125, partial [Actinoplanes sp.]